MGNVAVFGIVSSANLGDTKSVEGLIATYGKNTLGDFDAIRQGLNIEQQQIHDKICTKKIKIFLDSNKDNKVDLVAGASYGIDFFNRAILKDEELKSKYAEGRISFVVVSDRYYGGDLSGFERGITMLMPKPSLEQYQKENPNTSIKNVPIDLVSFPPKEDMDKASKDFADANPRVVNDMENLSYEMAVFVGGRVQISSDNWKENTVDIFTKEAEEIMKDAKGKSIIVGFHGLRSFTKGDKSNDFEPYDAFVNVLKSKMSIGQKIMLVTKEDGGNNTRKSIVEIFERKTSIGSKKYDIEDKGSSYYYMLNESSKKGVKLRVTAEQMNFIPELTVLGGHISNISPSYWSLTVKSNIDTYLDVMEKARRGERIVDAKMAFTNLKQQAKNSQKSNSNNDFTR